VVDMGYDGDVAHIIASHLTITSGSSGGCRWWNATRKGGEGGGGNGEGEGVVGSLAKDEAGKELTSGIGQLVATSSQWVCLPNVPAEHAKMMHLHIGPNC
jgi:hypothetical protein